MHRVRNAGQLFPIFQLVSHPAVGRKLRSHEPGLLCGVFLAQQRYAHAKTNSKIFRFLR